MKKLALLLLVLLGVYFLWRWWTGRDAATADRGRQLVYDRVWIDHLPTSETDSFQLFAAVTEQPMGVFQATSMWKGSFEMFRYEDKGDGKAVITYPQSKDKERVSYRAYKCKEGKFQFCLELDGASRGTRRYYSQDGWEIGSQTSLPTLGARIEALSQSQ